MTYSASRMLCPARTATLHQVVPPRSFLQRPKRSPLFSCGRLLLPPVPFRCRDTPPDVPCYRSRQQQDVTVRAFPSFRPHRDGTLVRRECNRCESMPFGAFGQELRDIRLCPRSPEKTTGRTERHNNLRTVRRVPSFYLPLFSFSIPPPETFSEAVWVLPGTLTRSRRLYADARTFCVLQRGNTSRDYPRRPHRKSEQLLSSNCAPAASPIHRKRGRRPGTSPTRFPAPVSAPPSAGRPRGTYRRS